MFCNGDTSRRSTPYSSGQRRILLSFFCKPNSPLARGVPAGRGVVKKIIFVISFFYDIISHIKGRKIS